MTAHYVKLKVLSKIVCTIFKFEINVENSVDPDQDLNLQKVLRDSIIEQGLVCLFLCCFFVCLFDSLCSINNLSVIKGWVFLG